MHAHTPPIRPSFRVAQRRAAEHAGIITATHREGRIAMRTHPIDNVPPSTASDRDDGIFVEATEAAGGGFRVYVTIADVAAHIPLSSPLASAAWERAFTRYRPIMNDPMFPKQVEDRLSLEHDQERLGLTIAIDLDAQFNPTHTEFVRTLTRGDNTDYAMASARMASDPQFALMATIAEGVRTNLKNRGLPEVDWARSKRALNLSESALKASRMVETFMLLANEQTARFASDAGIPFLYRNYNEQQVAEGGIARASYSTEALGHTMLEKSGWNGRYCHITSPIRRGADFLNAHQLHSTIDLLTHIESELLRTHPSAHAKALHHAVWQHAPALFRILLGRNFSAHTPLRSLRQQHVLQWCASQLEAAGCYTLHADALNPLLETVQAHKPPLSTKQLNEYAHHINRHNAAERLDVLDIKQAEREAERHQERLEKLAALPASLADNNEIQFSTLLRAAALTGVLPQPLLAEALQRIATDKWNRSTDGLSIMVIAKYPNDPAWLSLKRATARAIKHDPGCVSTILAMAERENMLGGTLSIGETSLPLGNAQTLPSQARNIQGAIMVLQEHDNGTIAPPYYSIGHDTRSASSHAQYSFLEHLAFGQLRPLDQSSIPNLLYAELDNSNQSRRAVAESIAHKMGATLSITPFTNASGEAALAATVVGGSVQVPIHVSAHTGEVGHPEKLEAALLRRLLRHESFKDASHFSVQPELRNALEPYEFLQQKATKAGGTLSIEFTEKRLKSSRTTHTATLSLALPSQPVLTLSRTGPNKDRARHEAATAMLKSKGWHTPLMPETARAWVNDISPEAGSEILADSTGTRRL